MKRRSRTWRLLAGTVLVFALNLTPALAGASSRQLHPLSLSFPTPRLGYVLSLYDCAARTCAALQRTTDGAATWQRVVTPTDLNKSLHSASWNFFGTAYATLTVHFADTNDGWIYGTVPAPATANTSNTNWVSRIWSTHNGGTAWREIQLPTRLSQDVVQMATHDAWTYVFGGSYQTGRSYILGTPSHTDEWIKKSDVPMWMPAGGTQLEAAFSFKGGTGLLVDGNDRGFGGAQLNADGTWIAWDPRSIEDIDASFNPIALVTKKVLLYAGQSAGFGFPPASSVPPEWNNGASWLFISYDAGQTFKPLRQLSRSYRGSYSTVPGLPATPAPGTILLNRTVNSRYVLVRSSTWGRTWQVVLNRPASQVAFPNPSTGFAIVQGRQSNVIDSSLFQSSDGGGLWRKVSLGGG